MFNILWSTGAKVNAQGMFVSKEYFFSQNIVAPFGEVEQFPESEVAFGSSYLIAKDGIMLYKPSQSF